MNTYSKYAPNVFLAKCPEKHQKGETIDVVTQYGKTNESVVYNFIFEKGGFYYYSIIRVDGYNMQERAKAKAERYAGYSANADKKSNQYYEASQEGKDFLSLGEPIKVGHHSEKRHRALINRNWNRMGKSVEFSKKANEYADKAAYWERVADENNINLSMPESLEFYQMKLEKAKEYHEGLKSGKYERTHSFSLTYAKKEANDLEKKVELAKKLWA